MSTYKKICITNRYLVDGSLSDRIKKILRTNVDIIILREKDMSDAQYEELAKSIIKLCVENRKQLILHSFKDIAIKLNWPHIHLTLNGFNNLSDEEKNFFRTIGVSTHSVDEAIHAMKNGATYITASHIFETKCKPDLKPRGLEYLEAVCKAVDIPVYALGGINMENSQLCIEKGASGICMMSEYMYKLKL